MERFKANEIPYEELKKLGLEKEAILNLPKQAWDRILTGRTSPLLAMELKLEDGAGFKFPAKFYLQRNDKGMPEIKFLPAMREIYNKYKLTPKEIEKLKNNETIVKTIDRGRGSEKCYLQLDKETNTVIKARTADIRIPDAIGDIRVGMEQQERMRNGEPVELDMGDTKVTVGVDLNDTTGFKVLKGDMDEWRMKKLIEWDRITPGATGYWQTSENGWQYQKTLEEKESASLSYSKGLKF